jgi:hypothetical protein
LILQGLILSFRVHGFENLIHDLLHLIPIGSGFVMEPLLETRDREQDDVSALDGGKLGAKLAEGAFGDAQGCCGLLRPQGKTVGQPEAMLGITVTITVSMIMVVMITWVHVVFPGFGSITGLHASPGSRELPPENVLALVGTHLRELGCTGVQKVQGFLSLVANQQRLEGGGGRYGNPAPFAPSCTRVLDLTTDS